MVGRPDDVTGEAIVAFVVLKGAPDRRRAKAVIKELQTWVGHEMDRSQPSRRDIHFGETCPRPAPARSCGVCRQLAKGRGNHPGHLDARKSSHSRPAQG